MMMTIRPYQKSDISAISDLMSQMGYPVSTDSMMKRMEMMNENSDYYTFVAVIKDEVIGMIGTRQLHFYEEDGHSTQITVMITDRSHEGKGIGKALMNHVEKLAKKNGANSLFLTSGIKPERERAHGFYKKMGFLVTGYRFVKRL